ncbi:MAG TPA: nuclear transport factor 2 family protein [Thermoleophilaceae bacterium]|nr:nuclear transport factor 2 family protein [Thermoleophilaceae bacterium]
MRDHFAAANELDFERAVAQFSEDVELVVHPDAFLDEGRFQGLDAVRRWFGNWFATFEPGYHFEIDEVRDLGDVVYMFAHHRGRGRSSGAEVSGQTAYLYTVREGTITRAELYSTPAEALEAAGVEE